MNTIYLYLTNNKLPLRDVNFSTHSSITGEKCPVEFLVGFALQRGTTILNFQQNESCAELCNICVLFCRKRFFVQLKIWVKIPQRIVFLVQHRHFVSSNKKACARMYILEQAFLFLLCWKYELKNSNSWKAIQTN